MAAAWRSTWGETYRDGFKRWELSLSAILARIEREWGELGNDPTIGDIGWFVDAKAPGVS
jgi:hypothetical protein